MSINTNKSWISNLREYGFFLTYGSDAPYKSIYPHFPEKVPDTNYVAKHIEIYNLIAEFKNLHEDYEKASESTRALIEPRLLEIAKTLARDYFVIKGEELL